MKLTANITNENVALSAVDGYADAGTTKDGTLAGLEVEIAGEVRMYERDASHVRPAPANALLTLSFANREHMRRVALLMLEKSGSPAFTEPEWRQIAAALSALHSEPHTALAKRIREAYGI